MILMLAFFAGILLGGLFMFALMLAFMEEFDA